MALLVNLDALIPREDFEAADIDRAGEAPTLVALRLSDLDRDAIARTLLRKPDFQRETNAWTPKKITDLIKSFLDGDLIPAVILWRSPTTNSLFAIDGAHRLSALIAWAYDDYGDGELSQRFFSHRIPDEQAAAADQTRKAIEKAVGRYDAIRRAPLTPTTATEQQVRHGQGLASLGINLQWVHGGVDKAEKSFKAINDKTTPIDKTELKLINDRRKPTALATRAILNAGTGHAYWGHFSAETQAEIRKAAKEINKMLFAPRVTDSIRDVPLPVAGEAYTGEAMALVFALMEFTSRRIRDTGSGPLAFGAAGKTEGTPTLNHLTSLHRILRLITGTSPASLALHPAVYYYSATGARQPAAIYAAIRLVLDLSERRQLVKFTEHRARFEDFLAGHKHYINQIIKKKGAGERSLPTITELYNTVLAAIYDSCDGVEIDARVRSNPSLKFLTDPEREEGVPGSSFSRTAKETAAMQHRLDTAPRCQICSARLQMTSASVDHEERKQDGGAGSADNAAFTHPFCNTGYKEHKHHMGMQ